MKTERITSSHIVAVLLKILGDISYYLTYLFVHCFALKISRGAMTSAYILFVYLKSTLFYKIIITAHNTNSCFIRKIKRSSKVCNLWLLVTMKLFAYLNICGSVSAPNFIHLLICLNECFFALAKLLPKINRIF